MTEKSRGHDSDLQRPMHGHRSSGTNVSHAPRKKPAHAQAEAPRLWPVDMIDLDEADAGRTSFAANDRGVIAGAECGYDR